MNITDKEIEIYEYYRNCIKDKPRSKKGRRQSYRASQDIRTKFNLKRVCLFCQRSLTKSEALFCSSKCCNEFKHELYIIRWKKGLEKGTKGDQLVSVHIHRYMRETYGEKCSDCGWNKRNPKTNRIPIQLHHIDGDYKNNREENLKLLCPNCHSLTEDFMSLNRGHGRKGRYGEVA